MKRKSLSRRLILQISVACLAGRAFAAEGPPLFRSPRYQFIELDPAVAAPTVALRRLDGRAATFKIAPGRVTLVYFWASWCASCRTSLPHFEQQQAMFKARNIDLVTVTTDETSAEHVATFLAGLGVRTLPVFWDPGGKKLRDTGSEGGEPPFVLFMGLPITFVVDSTAHVRGYMLGEADWASPEAQTLLRYYAA